MENPRKSWKFLRESLILCLLSGNVFILVVFKKCYKLTTTKCFNVTLNDFNSNLHFVELHQINHIIIAYHLATFWVLVCFINVFSMFVTETWVVLQRCVFLHATMVIPRSTI